MAENAERRHDPFSDFINFNLDMEGVDGVSFETVALALRDVIRSLPAERNGDMWADQLDRLQATLRLCLSIETMGRLMEDNPRFSKLDPQDLDLVVNLTITLAFICYNQLSERFGFETERLKAAREETARLWTTLRAASGWVEQAAAAGDPVAKKMASEIIEILESISPPNWNNNTRTLPG